MIVYLTNTEIDRVLWDNCVANSPGKKQYAYSWYLDIMAPGWQALVDDDYDSVFPLPGFKRYGIQYIATPIFLQQLGAFSPDNHEPGVVKEFIEYIPDIYKLVDLSIGQITNSNGFKVTEKVNFELDLSRPYETLWENFSTHCRRNIDNSGKKKPEINSDVLPEEIINLFANNKGKEIDGIKQRDYTRLQNLMNYCIENKRGRIFGVRGTKKRLLFGLFLLETEGNITMQFVVNTPESREKRIGYFVVNELIRTFSKTKTVLDFAGSSIPSVATFMKSFGSVNVPYYRIYRNRLIWPVRVIKDLV